jgi:AIR synthase-related protein
MALRASSGVRLKREIAAIADLLPHEGTPLWQLGRSVRNGDDAAAIPDGDGFILLAAEGMLPSFVARDPWFAGYCSVMVNVSDILAMGGRPYAVVDVLFSDGGDTGRALFAGMQAAAEQFGVPIVGGHTSRTTTPGQSLAVAIVGRARHLITSFDARPGDRLLVAVDLRGKYRTQDANYFDAATAASSERVRRLGELLPRLAEDGLVRAGKDVSMASFVGTLTMLCEGSGVGASLRLTDLPKPEGVALSRWLETFPSYGFLLAVAPEHASTVLARFDALELACREVGSFDESRCVTLVSGDEHELFWDLNQEPLTGFGPHAARSA